jgi:hypothetical protein
MTYRSCAHGGSAAARPATFDRKLAVGLAFNCGPILRSPMAPMDDERMHPGRADIHWIDQLNRVRVVRGEKAILDDVTISFLPTAKIGVVGPNGAGKSTRKAGRHTEIGELVVRIETAKVERKLGAQPIEEPLDVVCGSQPKAPPTPALSPKPKAVASAAPGLAPNKIDYARLLREQGKAWAKSQARPEFRRHRCTATSGRLRNGTNAAGF